ncbi:mariner Mos1 transposase [Elysia marginata]|uniref:Mariner Mos1 transposase n=1 Tax=Elysia marginata TaxID=1093978 RepID=A0AAV4GJC1_9GAST|nr:mariner Mos1 transposase [Elysia marginata]
MKRAGVVSDYRIMKRAGVVSDYRIGKRAGVVSGYRIRKRAGVPSDYRIGRRAGVVSDYRIMKRAGVVSDYRIGKRAGVPSDYRIGKRALVVSVYRTGKRVLSTTINAQYYKKVLQDKLSPAIRKKRPGLLESGILFHLDNAPVHTAWAVTDVLAGHKWELLEHPRYSPDLAPCDFHLFPKIKEHLRGQRFETEEDIIQATKVAIKNMGKCSYVTAFKDWLQRIEKCANNGGCYVDSAGVVNPLLLETEQDLEAYNLAEDRRHLRKEREEMSLLRKPPTEEETLIVHDLFLSSTDLT